MSTVSSSSQSYNRRHVHLCDCGVPAKRKRKNDEIMRTRGGGGIESRRSEWAELNLEEVEWTYDTKSNSMLTTNRKLQKRLDRFLICLRDFEAESVVMVGREPILGVTYLKQKEGGKELELPVLPSDQFVLLLTMRSRV